MNENEYYNYTIIDKDGKIVEDVNFDDYEDLADHMIDLAEKWYKGEYTQDDQLKISAYDKTGEMVYSDTASFGEGSHDIPNEFNLTTEGIPVNWKSGDGFGEKIN
jgi:hypothetical protein